MMISRRAAWIAGAVVGGTALVVFAGRAIVRAALRSHLETKPITALRAVFAAPEAEGAPDTVISILDTAVGLNMTVGPERGDLLDRMVRAVFDAAPLPGQPPACVAVELGAYYGYSAVRIGRLLPENAILYSIESDPLCAAIATKVVEYAGLASRVRVLVGTAATVLPRLRSEHDVSRIDLLLIDHAHEAYLPDFRAAEPMLRAGSVVVADNTRMAAEYVAAVQEDARYRSELHPFTLRVFGLGLADGVLVSLRV